MTRGCDLNENPANPFNQNHLGVIENDLGRTAVRATYLDALKKHIAENPGCDPIKAHEAVLASHPILAAALKGDKQASADAVKSEADAAATYDPTSDMPDSAVKDLFGQAVAAHLKSHPEDSPVKANRAVLAAHPTLAKALRLKGESADAATATANSRSHTVSKPLPSSRPVIGVDALDGSYTAMANSREETGLSTPGEGFLMRNLGDQWYFA